MTDKNKLSLYCFVENLTFTSWSTRILPFLIRRLAGAGSKNSKLFFINGTAGGTLIAGLTARLMRIRLEKLPFSLIDIRDDSGALLRLRIAYRDLAEVQEKIMKSAAFQKALHAKEVEKRIPIALAKSVGSAGQLNSADRTLWRALFVIQVALWKLKNDEITKADMVCFMARRPWQREIKSYGSKYGVLVVPVNREYVLPRPGELVRRLKARLPTRVWSRIVWSVNKWDYIRYQYLKHLKAGVFGNRGAGKSPQHSLGAHYQIGSPDPERLGPKLAVEYYGHLDLNCPERKSDLFFWQQSQLRGEDILITFALPNDPLDEAKQAEIAGHGMAAVALRARATTLPFVPVFHHAGGVKRNLPKQESEDRQDAVDNRFLRLELSRYYALYDYWADFFKKYNIKVYTSWYKFDATHCAMADALQDLGGITTIYQRSFEEFPSPETTVAADVVFGFTGQAAAIEKRQHSRIPYYVVTGYNGDHRAPLLRERAQVVRAKILSKGATRVLAFFDENSADDSRWHTGHRPVRENYSFLLEKILSEPWLGLVIKPKVPATLRRRLGDVAGLLEKAEQTGRCFVWGEGAVQGVYPPVAAALTADIAIHGHVCAATAGVEAALAGVPTLLLDREGWPVSRLYELGVGRVVFTNWIDLWEACRDHWRSAGGKPGFGDWSSMIDELDPFRDGRAAERMGTYLKWLFDDLKAGLGREQAMVNAAERYIALWGQDKVIEVGSDPEADAFLTKSGGRKIMFKT